MKIKRLQWRKRKENKLWITIKSMHPWPCIKHLKSTLTDKTVQNYTLSDILEEKKHLWVLPFFLWVCIGGIIHWVTSSFTQIIRIKIYHLQYKIIPQPWIFHIIIFIHIIKKKNTQNFILIYSVHNIMTFQTKILEVIPFISWSIISNIVDTT